MSIWPIGEYVNNHSCFEPNRLYDDLSSILSIEHSHHNDNLFVTLIFDTASEVFERCEATGNHSTTTTGRFRFLLFHTDEMKSGWIALKISRFYIISNSLLIKSFPCCKLSSRQKRHESARRRKNRRWAIAIRFRLTSWSVQSVFVSSSLFLTFSLSVTLFLFLSLSHYISIYLLLNSDWVLNWLDHC